MEWVHASEVGDGGERTNTTHVHVRLGLGLFCGIRMLLLVDTYVAWAVAGSAGGGRMGLEWLHRRKLPFFFTRAVPPFLRERMPQV